jgi:cytochrome c-type biogenesis protein CcmH/NrfG
MKTTFASIVLAALIATPALKAQMNPVPTESMGSYMHTPEQRAMEAYGRGIKLKKKAEGEQDAEKRQKLYLKAKDELSKSAGYLANYDAYLALGQVYLALGKRESAQDACAQAQGLKPSDAAAKSCIEEARKGPESAQAKPPGGR